MQKDYETWIAKVKSLLEEKRAPRDSGPLRQEFEESTEINTDELYQKKERPPSIREFQS